MPPLLPLPHPLTAAAYPSWPTSLVIKTQWWQFSTQKSPVGNHSVSRRHAMSAGICRH